MKPSLYYLIRYIISIAGILTMTDVFCQITNESIRNGITRDGDLKYKIQAPWFTLSAGSIGFTSFDNALPGPGDDVLDRVPMEFSLLEGSYSLFNNRISIGSVLYQRRATYYQLFDTTDMMVEGAGLSSWAPLVIRAPVVKRIQDKKWFKGFSLKGELMSYESRRIDSVRYEYFLPRFNLSVELNALFTVAEIGYSQHLSIIQQPYAPDYFYARIGFGLPGNALFRHKGTLKNDKASERLEERKRNYIARRYDREKFNPQASPPKLHAEIQYEDDNSNGILEALEKSLLIIRLSNSGMGTAQGIHITVTTDKPDKALYIRDRIDIRDLNPGRRETIEIPIEAGINVRSAEHTFTISIREFYGYDMDAAYLKLHSFEFQEPELQYAGYEVFDSGSDLLPINVNGLIEPGEKVRIKLIFQNVGRGTAQAPGYAIRTTEPDNIFLGDDISGTCADVKPGELLNIYFTVSPNKRVSTEKYLSLLLTLRDRHNKFKLIDYQLPILLYEAPDPPNIVTVTPNIPLPAAEIITESEDIRAFNLIDVRQVNPSRTKRSRSVGVVIGIENYDNITQAPYAANDATIMAQYFSRTLGIANVITRKEEETDGMFFDEFFNPEYGEILKYITPETELFLYYSGHAIPDETGSNVMLVSHDARLERISSIQNVSLSKLYGWLEKLHCKRTIVILDACFSGSSRASSNYGMYSLTQTKGPLIEPDEPWVNNSSFIVISSSQFREMSLGYDKSRTGLFTYWFCAGLKGEADRNHDRRITLGELEDYTRVHVVETSKKIRSQQTPVFHGDRDMIMVEY